MRIVLAAACAACVVAPSMPAAAQTAPQPRIEFTLYDTQTELRSLSGDPLPLAPALGWQRHKLNARTYSEHTMAIDERPDAALASKTHVEVVDGPGYSQLTVDQIMGDMHAVAGLPGHRRIGQRVIFHTAATWS